MNNFPTSFTLSGPQDRSHGSSSEEEVNTPVTIPEPIPPNLQMPACNNTDGNPYAITNAGGSVADSNTAERPRARSLGRPCGSRYGPNRERSTVTSMVLNVPPGVDLINWVIGYAESNRVCVNVLGGFGKISQVALTNPGYQVSPSQYTEFLTLITISGCCFFPRSVHPDFFNAALGRVNGVVIGGSALRMITMDHVVLNAIVFRNA